MTDPIVLADHAGVRLTHGKPKVNGVEIHYAIGVVPLGDQAVILGVPVQAAQRGDQVLLGAAPAPAVAPLHRAGLDQRH
jgi:hypothetical protein